MCVPAPAMLGLNVFPLTPFPDQTPAPSVEVVNAVERFMGALGRHIGLIVPVMVDGTKRSTGTMAVVV